MARKKIDGFLLDIDGTFLDSNDAHAKSWEDAFHERGHRPEYKSIRDCIGMGGDHLLPQLIGIKEESAEGRALSKRRGEIFRTNYLRGLKPFKGAQQLIEAFKQHGYKTIVATSAGEDDLKGLLGQAGLMMLANEATTSDDADSSKPNPDIIEAALRKGDMTNTHAIMIGDTPYDIEAAKRAGVNAIGFTCGGWSKESLSEAIAVYEGPADLHRAWAAAEFSADFWTAK